MFLIESCDQLFPELFAPKPITVSLSAGTPPLALATTPSVAVLKDDVSESASKVAPKKDDYVQITPDSEDDDDDDNAVPEEIGRLMCKHTYVARSPQELGFLQGDILIVHANLSKK